MRRIYSRQQNPDRSGIKLDPTNSSHTPGNLAGNLDGNHDGNFDVMNLLGNTISSAPKITFTILIVVTIFFFSASNGWIPGQTSSMSENISTNVDQYIPEGTEEKRILDLVRENWATKVVIILVKTGNFYDTNCKVNITDREVLEEISSVEGDDFYPGSDWARGDSGERDWIEYILSLPALIKEINSSTPRMTDVLQEELATELYEMFGSEVNVSDDDSYMSVQGKFSIPDQQRVDQIISNIPNDVLEGFCADTNDDGIWDITYGMMGCLEETPDEEERDFIDQVIQDRRTAQPEDAVDPYFQDSNGPHHTTMVQTGLIAIMIDITEEANDQLMETMPIAAGLVCLVMLVSHRSWKVFFIAGIPLVCTLFWTFGIITLTNIELSPLILAAMPMLIGLSVDYSLHISNRITEFEEQGHTIRDGIVKSYHTTGRAILLSAMTTMIGFAALFLAPLSPIRILGLMLIIGIGSAFFLSLTLVPCIIMMFHYKKPELQIWDKVAKVPIKHKWHIIGAVLIITMISLANFSTMTETEEERDEDPETAGVQSLDAIYEFGEIWSKGSMSLMILEPNPEARNDNYRFDGALNDTEFLDQINWLEENLTSIEDEVDVEDVSAMTIVDLYKSVVLNLTWTTVDEQLPPLPFPLPIDPVPDIIADQMERYYTITYWDFIHLSDDPDFQKRAIRIFYNSLTQEARDMLMTPDYSMTLCMIRYPYVGKGLGEQIIDAVNEDSDDASNREWVKDGEIRTATLQPSHATGGQAITLTIDEAIMDTQMKTLFFSMIFVFIALTVVFMDWKKKDTPFKSRFIKAVRWAGLTMIPVLSVIAWQPLIMKGVSSFEGGASLNMMTAMISSIVIGAGIDFGVHITERVREEGENIEGIQRAVQHTGQSIMEANLTTVAALSGALAVVWFRGFFSVLLLLLLYSMFAGMILLPSVYAVLAERKQKKLGKKKAGMNETGGGSLDTGLDFSEDGVTWEFS